jgi:hypothetical protein
MSNKDNIRNDEANQMYFVLRKFPELQNLALDCLHRPEDVVTGSELNSKTKSTSILNLNNSRKKRLPAEFSLPLEDQCTRKTLFPYVGSIASIPEVNEKMDNIRKSVLIERLNYRKSLAKERESFFPLSQIKNKVIDPLNSARSKLTKASLCFDSRSFINSLAGFQEGEPMSKEDVDTQLKRCLQINLSTEENDALFNSMDIDNSKYIDPVEFTRYFLSLGNIARDKSKQIIKIKKKRKEDLVKKEILDEMERQKRWEELSISSFVENDKHTAMKKLRDAAFKWDSTVDTLTTASFEGKYFKLNIYNFLNILLLYNLFFSFFIYLYSKFKTMGI